MQNSPQKFINQNTEPCSPAHKRGKSNRSILNTSQIYENFIQSPQSKRGLPVKATMSFEQPVLIADIKSPAAQSHYSRKSKAVDILQNSFELSINMSKNRGRNSNFKMNDSASKLDNHLNQTQPNSKQQRQNDAQLVVQKQLEKDLHHFDFNLDNTVKNGGAHKYDSSKNTTSMMSREHPSNSNKVYEGGDYDLASGIKLNMERSSSSFAEKYQNEEKTVNNLMRLLTEQRHLNQQLNMVNKRQKAEISTKNEQIYQMECKIMHLENKLKTVEKTPGGQNVVAQSNLFQLKQSAQQSALRQRENDLDNISQNNIQVVDIDQALDIFFSSNETEEGRRLKTRFLEAFLKFMGDYQEQIECVNHIFQLCQESPDDQTIKKKKIMAQFQKMGILKDDPRIKKMVDHLNDNCEEMIDIMDLTLSLRGVGVNTNPHIQFIIRVMTSDLLISEFPAFKQQIQELFNQCKQNNHGKPADYIPELAKGPPKNWGVSICTVEGQRLQLGQSKYPFSIQSCSKPLSYAFALEHFGPEKVHSHVGHEPSGVEFNAIILNKKGLPHNPLINSGAIMICSLLRPDLGESARFDYILEMWKRMAGGKKFEYDNKVYLSEKSEPYTNKALACLMRAQKAFPEGTDIEQTLQFYFMCCSLESDTDRLSIVAATLANNGINPLTGDRVLSTITVRETLSIMNCCGMYDYSGEFAFKIGMPAKSGVGGGIIVVVPGIMGFCTYSPPLDSYGNSSRGVQFCKLISQRLKLHQFNIEHDPLVSDNVKDHHYSLLSFSSKGNLLKVKHTVELMMQDEVKGYYNVCKGDYDARTALHLACSEGHFPVVQFLIENGFFKDIMVRDRWNNTPLDDAVRGKHRFIENYLRLQLKSQSHPSSHKE